MGLLSRHAQPRSIWHWVRTAKTSLQIAATQKHKRLKKVTGSFSDVTILYDLLFYRVMELD